MAKKRGLAGVPIAPLIIIIVGIIAVLYILKNKNLFKFGTATAGAVIDDVIQGPSVYQVVGDIPRSGAFGTSIANSGTSFRDNVSFPCNKCNRETTWFFVPGSGGGGGGSTGEDVTVKMGSHGGSSDETALISLGNIPLPGGGGEWRSEGPHGTDAGVSGTPTGSFEPGEDGIAKVGVKGVSWNPAGTQHHEIWYNADGTGAEWTMVAQFPGETSGNALTCPVPGGEGNCQDTLRSGGWPPD